LLSQVVVEQLGIQLLVVMGLTNQLERVVPDKGDRTEELEVMRMDRVLVVQEQVQVLVRVAQVVLEG
jgi:hypothetical protein